MLPSGSASKSDEAQFGDLELRCCAVGSPKTLTLPAKAAPGAGAVPQILSTFLGVAAHGFQPFDDSLYTR